LFALNIFNSPECRNGGIGSCRDVLVKFRATVLPIKQIQDRAACSATR
jgi:hypothetical protein